MNIATDQIISELSRYNEAEVRFHIIDPLVRQLGFASGDDVYFKPEEKLEYPYYHIGRRNKKKDLPLGYPDYRAGLKGRRGCFTIEAKAGHVELSRKDVEQAHSYAAHAQVGANFFVLSNGRQFQIFETLSGPESAPIIDLSIEELDERFHEIENVLSPTSLEKHCRVHYDKGLKLCEGLGSQVRFNSGLYTMDDWSYRLILNGVDSTDQFKQMLPQLADMEARMDLIKEQFELRVSKGTAHRNETGRIVAEAEFAGMTKNNAMAMRLLGIDRLQFETEEKFISTDVHHPSQFESTAGFSIKAGTSLPELFGGEVLMESDVNAEILVHCRLAKIANEIKGEFVSSSDYFIPAPGLGVVKLEFDMSGKFNLELDRQ